jgi:hypothetical protein
MGFSAPIVIMEPAQQPASAAMRMLTAVQRVATRATLLVGTGVLFRTRMQRNPRVGWGIVATYPDQPINPAPAWPSCDVPPVGLRAPAGTVTVASWLPSKGVSWGHRRAQEGSKAALAPSRWSFAARNSRLVPDAAPGRRIASLSTPRQPERRGSKGEDVPYDRRFAPA